MERFVAGDIIVVPFPFTDLSDIRKRPALVLSNLEGDDIVICEITSRIRKDDYVVSLENKDLDSGSLKTKSIIRPNRLLTINKNKVSYKFGKIKQEKLEEVLVKLKAVFRCR
ncbi:growth inhibitor PemK [Candidatus Pacearchaeota archaeon CG10_big_fil_rev_8_21_14_0_10_34_76]|nr:MAG: growth inhibitor PemK [Candidatus Pacearchaeota archaeon CG10_big_fil_rev_8_21_14_0_10_34_76]